MQRGIRSFHRLIFLAAMIAAVPGYAQTYPSRLVKVIVPQPPGGGVDVVGRAIAQKLADEFGQRFMVENRSGASGAVGSEFVARAAPDGYTLIVNGSVMVMNSFMMHNLPFDPVRDFAPVSCVAAGPLLFVTAPDFPANGLKEFIALVKAQPGRYSFGISGQGSPAQFATETFKFMVGAQVITAAYKGTGPALIDVMGGQVSAAIVPVSGAISLVRSGRLKPLGVTSASRTALVPNVPTVAEGGLPGFEFGAWYGLWAPAKTPTEVVARLQAAVAKAVQAPELRQLFVAQGVEPVGSSSENFAALIRNEIAKHAKLIRDTGLKFE